jgi:hypothetical protein
MTERRGVLVHSREHVRFLPPSGQTNGMAQYCTLPGGGLKLGKLGKLEAEATAAELRRRGGCIDVNFLSQVQKPPNRPMFSRPIYPPSSEELTYGRVLTAVRTLM